jgi:hypothetical protein
MDVSEKVTASIFKVEESADQASRVATVVSNIGKIIPDYMASHPLHVRFEIVSWCL